MHWAVYNGDAETSVTVIHMTPRLTAAVFGRAGYQQQCDIPSGATVVVSGSRSGAGSHRKLSQWVGLPIGEIQTNPKPPSPRLKKTDGLSTGPALRRANPQPGLLQTLARHLHPLARGGAEPLRLLLDQVSVVSIRCFAKSSQRRQTTRCRHRQRRALSIHLQPAGKRVMEIAEFLRGYPARGTNLKLISRRFRLPPTANRDRFKLLDADPPDPPWSAKTSTQNRWNRNAHVHILARALAAIAPPCR